MQDHASRLFLYRGDMNAEWRCYALTEAHAALETQFGTDMSRWRWGGLHRGHFDHAVSRVSDETLDVGPFAKDGSETRVMVARYDPETFNVLVGASVRMVIDVGAWDESVAINAPGQSGDPASPHYADLAPEWAAGRYGPLLYSREAVEAATETVIRLEPV